MSRCKFETSMRSWFVRWFHPPATTHKRHSASVSTGTALTLLTLAAGQTMAQTLPTMTITGVAASNDSAKISFLPVTGARDYRIYNVATPNEVKYAGRVHLFPPASANQHFVMSNGQPVFPYHTSASGTGPTRLDVPSTEIEVNGLPPGQPVTLVVEAMDQLGQMPPGNQSNALNAPRLPGLQDITSMLGSDAGITADGLYSINGQSGFVYTDVPHVIAQSKPFIVQATGNTALPSGSDATQVFFDTFANNTATFSISTNADASTMTGTLTTATNLWDVIGQNIDTKDTTPFVMGDHLMEVIFDAGTPGTNNPMHEGHGVLSYSPRRTFDFSNGQLLHCTWEVDAHTDGRRWIGMELAPANDPLQGFDQITDRLNNSDQAVFLAIEGSQPTLDVCYGVGAANTVLALDSHESGALGQAIHWVQRPLINYKYGRGIDNRSRFDLFLSQTHYALYEDGVAVMQYDFVKPIPFSATKIYFSHYLYHTINEIGDINTYTPWEKTWLHVVSYSDERHWDNLGAEVLPAGTTWSGLAGRAQPSTATPPTYEP